MKTVSLGIQNSVTSSYDKTKTTIAGHVAQKTINSQSVLGPTLTQFIDTQTQAAQIPSLTKYNPSTGRLFVVGTISATPTIMLFNVSSSGVQNYVGRIVVSLSNAAATTHTLRGFDVDDSGSTWQVYLGTTGSVAINGGVFLVNGLSAADFTPAGITIFLASASNQKAVYFLQDSLYPGVSNNITTLWGLSKFKESSNSSYNTKIYAMNNTVAAPQVVAFDTAVAPTVADQVINGVSSLTGGYSVATYGVSALCYLSMSNYNNYTLGTGLDPVVLMAGSASVPTGLTAWTANTAQVAASNVYFTRDVQIVNTFTTSALSSAIVAGATYSNGTVTFTCSNGALISATTALLNSTDRRAGAIASSGTLSLVSGTGPATITYSSYTSTAYFNVSTTSGGAAVVATSTNSGFTMMRAFGTSTNLFYGRTPIAGLTPALTGTLLQSNIVDYAKPTNAPLNAALNGQDCIAVATTSNLYLGKVSDLFLAMSGTSSGSAITVASTTGLTVGMAVSGPGVVPGSTIASIVSSTVITLSLSVHFNQVSPQTFVFGNNFWSSLTTSNVLGTGTDIVAPTVTYMKYSSVLDKFIYLTNTSVGVIKPLQNNFITGKFGNVDNTWLEAPSTLTAVPAGLAAVVGLEVQGGMVFLSGSTIGQRGITFIDLYSDHTFGNSYIISPITQVNPGSTLKYISTLEQLFDYTNTMNFYIRSAATAGDSLFNSASGGWVTLNKASDLALGMSNGYFQIMIDFNVLGSLTTSPSQLQEVILSILDLNEISDYWEGSVDNTTQNSASPAYTAFRLTKAYTSSVPTLYFRAYDDSGNLVASANTAANPTMFEYSSDNGVSWNSLGTIPNTIGTTEIRYKWTTPPGVLVTVSIREA